MKKDNEKKNRIKNVLKKIGKFIWNGLAVWGIVAWILLIVGACISINSPKQNNENQVSEVLKPIKQNLFFENEDYNYVFIPKTDIPTTWVPGLDTDTGKTVITFVPYDCVQVVGSSSFQFRVELGESSVIYDNEVRDDTYYELIINLRWWAGNTQRCDLDLIYLAGHRENLYIWKFDDRNVKPFTILGNSLNFNGVNIEPLPGREFDFRKFYNLFFDIYDSQDINYSFNNYNINPIQYLSYEIMNDNTAHNTGSYTATIDLDIKFVSNSQSFKKMRFQYDYILGSYYDNELTIYDNMTYLALSYIAYQKVYDDEWVKVCYPRIYKYETRTLNNVSRLAPYPFTEFDSYLWSNDGYKNIVIFDGAYNIYSQLSGDPIANLNNFQILTYQGELNRVGNIDISSTNNVFVLLGEGFSSVASLFGIILLPGITIGTLLFLPLVVAIVLAIIKLLRK